MRFKAYQICYLLKGNEQEPDKVKKIYDLNMYTLYKELNRFPRVKEGTQEYTIMYNKQEENIIAGVLAQSYNPMLSKFIPGESKEEVPILENQVNDKTYFYIDVNAKYLFIQNKRYPNKMLSPSISLKRIEYILGKILNESIYLEAMSIQYSTDELVDLFNKTYVTKVEYTNLTGIKLPNDARLHNPREDLDEALVETWNTYCEGSLEHLELKAVNGKSLNKNPFAKIGIYLAKQADNIGQTIIKKITINDAGGSKEEIKPKGNEYKIIHIQNGKQDDHNYVFERIFSNTSNK